LFYVTTRVPKRANMFKPQIKYSLLATIGSQVGIRLRNDLYCVEWGVKLYSLTQEQVSIEAALKCGDLVESCCV